MSKFNKTKLAAAIGASAITILALNVNAASDGTLGATSDGDIDITMSVNALVRITGLTDIVLTDPNTDGVFTGSDTFCVGTNQASVDYQVTLDMNSETSFTLQGDNVEDLAFTPSFFDGTTTVSNFVEATQHATNFTTTSNEINGTCTTPNTTLSIATADATGNASSNFSGTINILIDPV